MATPTSADINACMQYKSYLSLENGADTRFEPVSPYPSYTKPQLDMRRKWEVLQHKQNAAPMTRSKRWSTLVQNTGLYNCPENVFAKTNSTGCDVPGPVTQFSYDPNVPLYMYLPNIGYLTLQEGEVNQPSTNVWDIFPVYDVAIPNDGTYATIANQVILKPQHYNYYMYLSVPISLSLSAVINNNLYSTPVSRIDTYVTSANVEVYYSTTLVTTVALSTIELYTMSTYPGQSLGTMQATHYVGNLKTDAMQPMYISALPQYIYTYNLQVNLQTVLYDENNTVIDMITSSNVSGVQASTIANIADIGDPNYASTVNCHIQLQDYMLNFREFSMYGTGTGNPSLC